MTEQLQTLIAQFTGLRLIVVGDVILDEYLIGRAMRLSREAPVPVLEFEQRQEFGDDGHGRNMRRRRLPRGGAGAIVAHVPSHAAPSRGH